MNTITKYILTGIVAAAVAGGVTYYTVNLKATSDKQDLQSQIDSLTSKVNSQSSTTTTTASTDQTSGWKTYSNTKYSFSVKYPADWSASEEGSTALYPLATDISTASTLGTGVNIAFHVTAATSTLDSNIATEVARYSSFANYAKSTTTVGGVSATQITYTDSAGYTWKADYLSTGGYTWIIGGISTDPKKTNGQDLGKFDLMVGTVSFSGTTISACQSSNLVATLTNGSGTAGTYYYNLNLKNNGTTSCTYSGTTTVSLLNSSGTALDSKTASINSAHTTIASGASITAQVSFPDSGNFSTGTCKSGVTTLAVYPPNQTTAVTVTGMDTKNAGFTNFYCPSFAVASF